MTVVGNFSGVDVVVVDRVKEMTVFDLLPPNLRQTLRDAVMPHPAVNVAELLVAGTQPSTIQRALESDKRRLMGDYHRRIRNALRS